MTKVRTAGGGRHKLAPSLNDLLNAVDTRWPRRDRKTDGWLGDTAHQARISGHNPDSYGIVHAVDIDKDGIDVAAVLRSLIGHPAIWYVIHDRKIWSRTYGWKARRYAGPNPHTGHLHVEIMRTAAAEKWVGDWLATVRRTSARTMREGMHGADVKRYQRLLGVVPADGIFGPQTAAAVNKFKREHGWAADGVLGWRVRKALREGP